MDLIIDNAGKIIGTIASGIVIYVLKLFFYKKPKNNEYASMMNTININNTNNGATNELKNTNFSGGNLEIYKTSKRILFIDDDTKFKVVQILKTTGWTHTKIIKDVKSLDCAEILEADILFVDIQGVGKLLAFADEGLGLADAIKTKYPLKKVIIYSAETKGDRFHKALRTVDSFLAKNADPYEFQQLIENFSVAG